MAMLDGKETKSRRERRKDARQAKHQQRLLSWTLHQGVRRNWDKKTSAVLVHQQQQPVGVVKKQGNFESKEEEVKGFIRDGGDRRGNWKKQGRQKRRKSHGTMFEEYLEMERQKTMGSAEEDLALERKLAKKLKVKDGLLRGPSDGMEELLEHTAPLLSLYEEDACVSEEDLPEKLPRTKKKNAKKGQQQVKEGFLECEIGVNHTSSGFELKDDDHVVNRNDGSDEEAQTGLLKDDQMDGSTDSLEQQRDGIMRHLDGGENKLDSLQDVVSKTDAYQAKGNTEDVGIIKLTCKESAVKYIAPHLRGSLENGSNELFQLQRHTRGLLNRLSEANVESVVLEFSRKFQTHGRRVVIETVTNEILEGLCNGPRGNDQYAAVFAAFVTGVSCLVGIDFGAKFVASLAGCFENQYMEGDALALRNLTLLFCSLYNFKLLSGDMIYDLLHMLCKRLEELDVSTILVILQSCGMGLRSDDPAAMKEFVLNVQKRTQELRATTQNSQNEDVAFGGKRMNFMLETICEIKNNKRRSKDESAPHMRLQKWLHKLRVEDVQLRAISWEKLLEPAKKGQWWFCGGIDRVGEDQSIDVADAMNMESGEAEKMMQLASLQRMNTDTRRAVFCIIMTGEDYLDAFEKILRLNLHGKQDRDVLRVVVECCLQEKVFNKYYSLLAAKLCHHDKNHRFTLQYCFWDHFKRLDVMETRRIVNLAHLLADLIGTFSLSIAVLKAVDFGDSKIMTPKVVLYFHIFMVTLLTGFADDIIWNVFSHITNPLELENLRHGLLFFFHEHLKKDSDANSHLSLEEKSALTRRCQLAQKALTNTIGIKF